MSQNVSTEKLIEGTPKTTEKSPSWWERNKPLGITLIILGIVVLCVIIAVIILFVKKSSKNKPEGFSSTQLGTDTSIEINGNIIDCKPEIDYMKQFIQTSIGID